MVIQIILLIIGFILLIKGADWFVDGASSIASNFKVSKMLIGLTVVAFGTSAPEFAVSIQSHLNGAGELLIGNVIGSNILNILLVIGIGAFIYPITIKSATVKKELPMLLLITTLLSIVVMDNIFDVGNKNFISRSDGFVIFMFFLVFIYYLISVMKNKKSTDNEEPKYKLFKSIVVTVIGISLVVIGSNMVVLSATKIAKILEISERIIALTVVALGTSLPELVTTIVSALKKEQDILVGNIIGSNIFNICFVLGIPIMIFGGVSATGFSYIDIIVMLLAAILLFIFSKNNYRISKMESIIMLLLFCSYYSIILIKGGI